MPVTRGMRLLVLGLLAVPLAFAQAAFAPTAIAQEPRSLSSGRAPVPNVRAPLPQKAPPSVAAPSAAAAAAATPSEGAPLENPRPWLGAAGAVRVINGDTIRFEGRTYRLWGIDAPELVQVCEQDGRLYGCGREAAAYLRKLLSPDPASGASATDGAPRLVCEPRTSDQYGRPIALCRNGELDLAEEMVRAGWALVFARHGTDYAPLEEEARQARRGLWAGTFDMPWEWRAKKLSE